MASPPFLAKLVWGGKLCTTETWSCSLHVLGVADTAFIEANLTWALTQWFQRSESAINKWATLDFYKYNAVQSVINPKTGRLTERYLDPANSRTVFLSVLPSAGMVAGAPQLSLAVTTVTAATRGRASKGRFYPPTAFVDARTLETGQLINGMASSCATSAAQLITDINGAVGGSVVIYSQVGGTTRQVTGVRVGQVQDTQRRRRRSIPELPVSAVIA